MIDRQRKVSTPMDTLMAEIWCELLTNYSSEIQYGLYQAGCSLQSHPSWRFMEGMPIAVSFWQLTGHVGGTLFSFTVCLYSIAITFGEYFMGKIVIYFDLCCAVAC